MKVQDFILHYFPVNTIIIKTKYLFNYLGINYLISKYNVMLLFYIYYEFNNSMLNYIL